MEGRRFYSQEMKPILWKPLLCRDSFLSLCFQQMLEAERFFCVVRILERCPWYFFKFQAMNLKLCVIPVATKDSLVCLLHCQGHVDSHCTFKPPIFEGMYRKICIWNILWVNLNHMREASSLPSYKTSFITRATTSTTFTENPFLLSMVVSLPASLIMPFKCLSWKS